MTPERLREIAQHHADEAPDCRPGLMVWHPQHAQAHADRGELLDLLRRIDLIKPIERGGWICTGCDAETPSTGRDDLNHAPDCPAPALEAYKEATRTT